MTPNPAPATTNPATTPPAETATARPGPVGATTTPAQSTTTSPHPTGETPHSPGTRAATERPGAATNTTAAAPSRTENALRPAPNSARPASITTSRTAPAATPTTPPDPATPARSETAPRRPAELSTDTAAPPAVPAEPAPHEPASEAKPVTATDPRYRDDRFRNDLLAAVNSRLTAGDHLDPSTLDTELARQDTGQTVVPRNVEELAGNIAHAVRTQGRELRPRMRGGAIGIELENRRRVEGIEYVGTMVTSDYFDIVIDKVGNEPIFEIVTKPIATLPGDTGRLDPAQTLSRVETAIRKLEHSPEGTLLSDLFPAHEGYHVNEPFTHATLGPVLGRGGLALQLTTGIPPAGMFGFLRAIHTGLMHEDSESVRTLELGLQVGAAVADRFAGVRPGSGHRSAVDALATDAEVQALAGYLTLLHVQVSALAEAIGHYPPDRRRDYYPKLLAVVLSRVDMPGYRNALPAAVQEFLDAEAPWIREQIVRHLRRQPFLAAPNPRGHGPDVLSWGERGPFTVGDYLDSGLLAAPPRAIGQAEALHVGTTFPTPDTNDGRLPRPLIPVEIRAFPPASARNFVRDHYDTVDVHTEEANEAAEKAYRLTPAPTAGPAAEVDFASGVHTYQPRAGDALADFAAYVGQQAGRAALTGSPGLVVVAEGGGNGGRSSRGAQTVGTDRARSVSEALESLLGPQLDQRGIARDFVRVDHRSRGDGPSASPHAPPGNGSRDQRRRVMLWVAEQAPRRLTSASTTDVRDSAPAPRARTTSAPTRARVRVPQEAMPTLSALHGTAAFENSVLSRVNTILGERRRDRLTLPELRGLLAGRPDPAPGPPDAVADWVLHRLGTAGPSHVDTGSPAPSEVFRRRFSMQNFLSRDVVQSTVAAVTSALGTAGRNGRVRVEVAGRSIDQALRDEVLSLARRFADEPRINVVAVEDTGIRAHEPSHRVRVTIVPAPVSGTGPEHRDQQFLDHLLLSVNQRLPADEHLDRAELDHHLHLQDTGGSYQPATLDELAGNIAHAVRTGGRELRPRVPAGAPPRQPERGQRFEVTEDPFTGAYEMPGYDAFNLRTLALDIAAGTTVADGDLSVARQAVITGGLHESAFVHEQLLGMVADALSRRAGVFDEVTIGRAALLDLVRREIVPEPSVTETGSQVFVTLADTMQNTYTVPRVIEDTLGVHGLGWVHVDDDGDSFLRAVALSARLGAPAGDGPLHPHQMRLQLAEALADDAARPAPRYFREARHTPERVQRIIAELRQPGSGFGEAGGLLAQVMANLYHLDLDIHRTSRTTVVQVRGTTETTPGYPRQRVHVVQIDQPGRPARYLATAPARDAAPAPAAVPDPSAFGAQRTRVFPGDNLGTVTVNGTRVLVKNYANRSVKVVRQGANTFEFPNAGRSGNKVISLDLGGNHRVRRSGTVTGKGRADIFHQGRSRPDGSEDPINWTAVLPTGLVGYSWEVREHGDLWTLVVTGPPAELQHDAYGLRDRGVLVVEQRPRADDVARQPQAGVVADARGIVEIDGVRFFTYADYRDLAVTVEHLEPGVHRIPAMRSGHRPMRVVTGLGGQFDVLRRGTVGSDGKIRVLDQRDDQHDLGTSLSWTTHATGFVGYTWALRRHGDLWSVVLDGRPAGDDPYRLREGGAVVIAQRRAPVDATHLAAELNTRIRDLVRVGDPAAYEVTVEEAARLAATADPEVGIVALAQDLAPRLLTGERLRMLAGAIGFEAELHGYPVRLPRDVEPDDVDFLVDAPDYQLVLDAVGEPVIELVTKPIAAVPGDDGRRTRSETMAAITDALRRLAQARDNTPLSLLFDGPPFQLDPLADDVRLRKGGRRATDELYLHFTVGVPLAGLREFLGFTAVTMRDDSPVVIAARNHLEDGLELGDELAGQLLPGASPQDRVTLAGYLAAVYSQFAALAQRTMAPDSLAKNFAAVSLRVHLDGIRAGLSTRVRQVLDEQSGPLAERFLQRVSEDHYTKTVAKPGLDQRLPMRWPHDPERTDATFGDYLATAFRDDPARRVTQREALGIRSSFPALDTNPDEHGAPRLPMPLLPIELRHLGPRRATADDLEQTYDLLEEQARERFADALALRTEAEAGDGKGKGRAADPVPPAAPEQHLDTIPEETEEEPAAPGTPSPENSPVDAVELPEAVEVAFAERGTAVRRDQHPGLRAFAAELAEAVRDPLVVHVEGGGNGGSISRGAERTGRMRAEAVRDVLRPMLDEELARRGLPSSTVDIQVSSRGDTASAGPFAPAPGTQRERRRRVAVWAAPADTEHRETAVLTTEPHRAAIAALADAIDHGSLGALAATPVTDEHRDTVDRLFRSLPPTRDELYAELENFAEAGYDPALLAELARRTGSRLDEVAPDVAGWWLSRRVLHLAWSADTRYEAVRTLNQIRDRPAALAAIVGHQDGRRTGLAGYLGVDFPDVREIAAAVHRIAGRDGSRAAWSAVTGIEHDTLSLVRLAEVYRAMYPGADLFADLGPHLGQALRAVGAEPAAGLTGRRTAATHPALSYDLDQLERALAGARSHTGGDVEFRVLVKPTRMEGVSTRFGHAWVEVRLPIGGPNPDGPRFGRRFSVGFWPSDSSRARSEQDGVIRSPDRSEVATTAVPASVTVRDLERGLAFIRTVQNRPYFWRNQNCVTFARGLHDAVLGDPGPFTGLGGVIARAVGDHPAPRSVFPADFTAGPDRPAVVTFDRGAPRDPLAASSFASRYASRLLDRARVGLAPPAVRITVVGGVSRGAIERLENDVRVEIQRRLDLAIPGSGDLADRTRLPVGTVRRPADGDPHVLLEIEATPAIPAEHAPEAVHADDTDSGDEPAARDALLAPLVDAIHHDSLDGLLAIEPGDWWDEHGENYPDVSVRRTGARLMSLVEAHPEIDFDPRFLAHLERVSRHQAGRSLRAIVPDIAERWLAGRLRYLRDTVRDSRAAQALVDEASSRPRALEALFRQMRDSAAEVPAPAESSPARLREFPAAGADLYGGDGTLSRLRRAPATGLDSTGTAREFAPDRVRSTTVQGFDGTQAGVDFADPGAHRFPDELFRDAAGLTGDGWAGTELYVLDPGQTDPVAAMTGHAFSGRTPPWAPVTPFFVVLPDRTADDLRDGLFPVVDEQGRELRLDARTLARVVLRSPAFRNGFGSGTRPVVLLTTSVAEEGDGGPIATFAATIGSQSRRVGAVHAYAGRVSTLITFDRANRVPVAFTRSGGHWLEYHDGTASRAGVPAAVRVVGHLGATIDEGGRVRTDPANPTRLIDVASTASQALSGRDGMPAGVALGIEDTDIRKAKRLLNNGGIQRVYRREASWGDPAPPDGYTDTPVPVPWRPEIAGPSPFLVVGHNSAIATHSGITRVNGTALALAFMGTPEFAQAHRDGSGPSAYVLLACSTARLTGPGGTAYDFQRTLAEHGHPAPVIAATDVVSIGGDGVVVWNGDWRVFRGEATSGPVAPVRISFGEGSRDVAPEHAQRLNRFATAMAARLRDTGSRMVVHLEGGGNGGFRSEGAQRVGLRRAGAVRDLLTPELEEVLTAQGIPRDRVELRVSSRGDGTSAHPDGPRASAAPEARRGVLLWTEQAPGPSIRTTLEETVTFGRGSTEPDADRLPDLGRVADRVVGAALAGRSVTVEITGYGNGSRTGDRATSAATTGQQRASRLESLLWDLVEERLHGMALPGPGIEINAVSRGRVAGLTSEQRRQAGIVVVTADPGGPRPTGVRTPETSLTRFGHVPDQSARPVVTDDSVQREILDLAEEDGTETAAPDWAFPADRRVYWQERYPADSLAARAFVHQHYGDFLALNARRFGDGEPGYLENCVNVSVGVVEMLAGRRFEPAPAPGPRPRSLLEDHFGAPAVPVRHPGEIVERLVAAGPGAHGIVFRAAGPEEGSGHVFNAIHRPDGSIVFLDAQQGRLASLPETAGYRFLLTGGGDAETRPGSPDSGVYGAERSTGRRLRRQAGDEPLHDDRELAVLNVSRYLRSNEWEPILVRLRDLPQRRWPRHGRYSGVQYDTDDDGAAYLSWYLGFSRGDIGDVSGLRESADAPEDGRALYARAPWSDDPAGTFFLQIHGSVVMDADGRYARGTGFIVRRREGGDFVSLSGRVLAAMVTANRDFRAAYERGVRSVSLISCNIGRRGGAAYDFHQEMTTLGFPVNVYGSTENTVTVLGSETSGTPKVEVEAGGHWTILGSPNAEQDQAVVEELARAAQLDWHYQDEQRGDGLVPVNDRYHTLELVRSVRDGLVRGNVLDLTAAERLTRWHERPDIVWRAAFQALSGDPAFPGVRHVRDMYRLGPGGPWRTVHVPRQVRELYAATGTPVVDGEVAHTPITVHQGAGTAFPPHRLTTTSYTFGEGKSGEGDVVPTLEMELLARHLAESYVDDPGAEPRIRLVGHGNGSRFGRGRGETTGVVRALAVRAHLVSAVRRNLDGLGGDPALAERLVPLTVESRSARGSGFSRDEGRQVVMELTGRHPRATDERYGAARPGFLDDGDPDHLLLRVRDRRVPDPVADELGGPDPYGLRRPRPAPEFLSGYDYARLPADRRAAFFRALDLTRPDTPTARDLDLARLTPGEVGGEFPRLLHTTSTGDPEPGHLDTLRRLAGTGFEVVLWTGHARGRVPAGLASWARDSGVRVVSLDEIFHAGAPMTNDAAFRIERARRSAAAPQLAGAEIVARFGGIHFGDAFTGDPAEIARLAADGEDETARAGDGGVLAAPAGSREITALLTTLGDQYARPRAGTGVARRAQELGLAETIGTSVRPARDTPAAVLATVTALHRELRARSGVLYLPAVAQGLAALPRRGRDAAWQVVIDEFADTLGDPAGVSDIAGHGVDVPAAVRDQLAGHFPGATLHGFQLGRTGTGPEPAGAPRHPGTAQDGHTRWFTSNRVWTREVRSPGGEVLGATFVADHSRVLEPFLAAAGDRGGRVLDVHGRADALDVSVDGQVLAVHPETFGRILLDLDLVDDSHATLFACDTGFSVADAVAGEVRTRFPRFALTAPRGPVRFGLVEGRAIVDTGGSGTWVTVTGHARTEHDGDFDRDTGGRPEPGAWVERSSPGFTMPGLEGPGGPNHLSHTLERGGVVEGLLYPKDAAGLAQDARWFAAAGRDRTLLLDIDSRTGARMTSRELFENAYAMVDAPHLRAGGRTFYLVLHSLARHAAVYTSSGEELTLDGVDFAKLVRRSDAFRRAFGGRGERPTSFTLVGCQALPGMNSDMLAFQFYEDMAENGFDLPVHAASQNIDVASDADERGGLTGYLAIWSGGRWATVDSEVMRRRRLIGLLGRPETVDEARNRIVQGQDEPAFRSLVIAHRAVSEAVAHSAGNALDVGGVVASAGRSPWASTTIDAAMSRLADVHAQTFRSVTDLRRTARGEWAVVAMPEFARDRYVVTGKGQWHESTVTRPAELVPGYLFPHRSPWQVGDTVAHQATIPFVRGRAEVADPGALGRVAHWVAEAALERRADGLPLPVARIHGVSHSMLSGNRIALGRAHVVHEELLRLIRARLSTLAPGTAIDAAGLLDTVRGGADRLKTTASGVLVEIWLPPQRIPRSGR
ncbi:toxin glutamine deamidase domain-containing protein [Amycolatopsis sp. NPDC059021]|uniref:toxin glutamine deamidase domain-containing protein n=1 Tax=Amycolatopsis sp. NPDC059021 TaxID=3346704 RepID=UPI00366DA970